MKFFDLTGPEFLQLFMLLFIVALALAFFLPQLLRGPSDIPTDAGRDLDPCEIGYLKGGNQAALRVAIVALYHRGFVNADKMTCTFTRTALSENGFSPIEAINKIRVLSLRSKHRLRFFKLP